MFPSRQERVAALIVTLATFAFSAMDACTKYAGNFFSAEIVLWVRFFIQAVVMGIWIGASRGWNGFKTTLPVHQVLRGFLLLAIGGFAFKSLGHIPLAEFTAVFMLTPVLVTVMAGLLFQEKPTFRHYATVLTAFTGVVMIVRPGSLAFGIGGLYAFATTMCATAYNLLTRHLAVREDVKTLQFYAGLAATLGLVPVLLLGRVSKQLDDVGHMQFGLLVAIGILGSIGHVLVPLAFRRAKTVFLMPFMYAQLGFAALIDWAVFRHLPDFFSWVGMGIIVLCGVAASSKGIEVRKVRRQPTR